MRLFCKTATRGVLIGGPLVTSAIFLYIDHKYSTPVAIASAATLITHLATILWKKHVSSTTETQGDTSGSSQNRQRMRYKINGGKPLMLFGLILSFLAEIQYHSLNNSGWGMMFAISPFFVGVGTGLCLVPSNSNDSNTEGEAETPLQSDSTMSR